MQTGRIVRRPLKSSLVFALRVIAVYAVLAFPWTGWHRQWARILQGLATAACHSTGSATEITFAPWEDSSRTDGIRATIVNRDLMNANGSGPVRTVDIKQGALELSPLALYIALILATPLPWKRRSWQLAAGLILVQGVMLAFLRFCLWREAMELVPSGESASWKWLWAALRLTSADYLGLVTPIAVWLLFNARADRERSGMGWYFARSEGKGGTGDAPGVGTGPR